MNIKKSEAKSILRKHKGIDSWFISHYGMNLYRGCSHNCAYCDGRAEKYQVDGIFGSDLVVKENAIDILHKELDPGRRRKPLKKSYMVLGGGVSDSYQPIDAKYQFSRKALELFLQFDFPVHILTKSTLVLRDLDILQEINKKTRALVSFSFSSVDEKLSNRFEPGVPAPQERVEAMQEIKRAGIACGMFLMPVIPFVTDDPHTLDRTIQMAKATNADFIIFGGMTLKAGRQRSYFYQVLKQYNPDILLEYDILYKDNRWGEADAQYYHSLNQLFYSIIKKYRIPIRIPLSLYGDILDQNDRVCVILDQLDYLLKLRNFKSSYGYASYNIKQLKEPLHVYRNRLGQIKGVGKATATVIREIMDTGTSLLYTKLLGFN